MAPPRSISNAAQISQKEAHRQGSDINSSNWPARTKQSDAALHRNPIFYLLLILPLAVNAGILACRGMPNSWPQHIAVAAGEGLAARDGSDQDRRGELKTDHWARFYSGLGTALTQFLADRFRPAEIELTRDQIQDQLAERGIKEPLIQTTTGLLDR